MADNRKVQLDRLKAIQTRQQAQRQAQATAQSSQAQTVKTSKASGTSKPVVLNLSNTIKHFIHYYPDLLEQTFEKPSPLYAKSGDAVPEEYQDEIRNIVETDQWRSLVSRNNYSSPNNVREIRLALTHASLVKTYEEIQVTRKGESVKATTYSRSLIANFQKFMPMSESAKMLLSKYQHDKAHLVLMAAASQYYLQNGIAIQGDEPLVDIRVGDLFWNIRFPWVLSNLERLVISGEMMLGILPELLNMLPAKGASDYTNLARQLKSDTSFLNKGTNSILNYILSSLKLRDFQELRRKYGLLREIIIIPDDLYEGHKLDDPDVRRKCFVLKIHENVDYNDFTIRTYYKMDKEQLFNRRLKLAQAQDRELHAIANNVAQTTNQKLVSSPSTELEKMICNLCNNDIGYMKIVYNALASIHGQDAIISSVSDYAKSLNRW